MKFFTDKTVVNDYLMVKYIDYLKMEDFSKWKEVFIDPGVWELTKTIEYSWVYNMKGHYKIIEWFLDNLPDNHYFSWDYPCDMNLAYQDLFLEKSWYNAKYFHDHAQYIITVQSKFNNYWNFMEWFDKYNSLEIKSGILALGNMCRFRSLNQYLKHALSYAFYKCKHPRIHIYGLCMKAIPYANELSKKTGIVFSFDSTKWTRCFHTSGLPSCNSSNRQQYFDEYKAKVMEGGEQ